MENVDDQDDDPKKKKSLKRKKPTIKKLIKVKRDGKKSQESCTKVQEPSPKIQQYYY
jgi:hypothetical protein